MKNEINTDQENVKQNKGSVVHPIEDQELNDNLQSVISDYWKDRQAPGFTGYKEKRQEGQEEEILPKEDENESDGHISLGETSGRNKRGRKKKNSSGSRAGKIVRNIFLVLLLFIVVSVGTFAFMRYTGQKSSLSSDDSGEKITTPEEAVSENSGKVVTYKGQTYTYNEDISTILFIGVDRENYNKDELDQEESGSGQSDTIILVAINHTTGETKMIPISRNTMVEVDEYNSDGTYWRQKKIQLALAFAYGDGEEGSCKNVSKAVSRLFYGMPVNQYVSLDLSCIKTLNNAVGGVTVSIPDELVGLYPEFTQGATVTLNDEQAEAFVRYRKTTIENDDEDNNAPRMERQKIYMNAFVHQVLSRMKKKPTLPLTLYNDVKQDMITDVTSSEVLYYSTLIATKGFNNTVLSIDGKVTRGEFTEVTPDKEQLYQLVLDTFYTRD